MLEEGGEVSSPPSCPIMSPGPQSRTCCVQGAPAPTPLGPGTLAYPRRLEKRTHPGLQFVRRGGCGWEGEGGILAFPTG